MAVITIGFLIYLALAQLWAAETYAAVFSAVATTISIIFLVLDKTVFDKPNFTLVERKGEASINIRDIYVAKYISFLFQNDGLRDANSVTIKAWMITKGEVERITNMKSHLLTSDSYEAQALKVPVGEQFEVLLPDYDLRQKVNVVEKDRVTLRVEIHSAFIKAVWLYEYRLTKENQLKFIELPPLLQVIREAKFQLKTKGFKRILFRSRVLWRG